MKTYRYDLHIHSCLSPCGDDEMTPATIAGLASLGGLDIAALTDHNTCGNCAAFLRACEAYGVVGIPGMELTTAEDVHLLCLFSELSDAEAFSEAVAAQRVRIANRPDIFGHQYYMNEDDGITGEEPDLLINATELFLSDAASLVRAFHGVPVPAHADKASNGIIAMLGALPADCGFKTVEYTAEYAPDAPGAEGLFRICDSDAHYPQDIRDGESASFMRLPGETPEEIRMALLRRLEEGK